MKKPNGIKFRNINVNYEGINSGIFIGGTKSPKWSLKEKTNEGFGRVYNNKPEASSIYQNLNLIFDQDIIDHSGYKE